MANWLYNKLLEHANALRKQYRATQDKAVGRTLYTEGGLRDLIPSFKTRHPFLKAVYSSVLKNAALQLSKAIRDYQDGKHGRRKNVVNWPTFRAWKRNWFSLQYDEPWKGYALAGRTLSLVLGEDATGKQLRIELELVEPLPHWVNQEHIRQCRLVKEGQIYSVVFSVERVLPNGKPHSPKRVAALDPNHKNFAYVVGSDGKATEIHNPYFLKSFDKRIDALKSKRDRCKTKQFLYTIANHLYAEYDAVSVEDYVPHGGGITKKMRRAMNNRSLNRRFKQVLAWVALRSGKVYLEWEEGGSTRTCHDCGFVVEEGIPVEVREWNSSVK
jgi:putative transposase